jgi:hypothetical protein
MCVHARKIYPTNPNKKRSYESKEQKAKRTRALYTNMRAAAEMVEELKDERSAISKFIKRFGFDPGQSGENSGSVDPH